MHGCSNEVSCMINDTGARNWNWKYVSFRLLLAGLFFSVIQSARLGTSISQSMGKRQICRLNLLSFSYSTND